jgi:hypothetical protein
LGKIKQKTPPDYENHHYIDQVAQPGHSSGPCRFGDHRQESHSSPHSTADALGLTILLYIVAGKRRAGAGVAGARRPVAEKWAEVAAFPSRRHHSWQADCIHGIMCGGSRLPLTAPYDRAL